MQSNFQPAEGDSHPRGSHTRSHILKRFFRGAASHRGRRRLRQFAGYYRPHLKILLADLACAALVAATAIALPLCVHFVASNLLESSDIGAAIDRIVLVGGLMALLVAVQVLAIFFVDYQGHVMGARIEAAVRRDLFEHCQKLSFGFYDRQRVGQLMSRITTDSLWMGELFHHGPEDLAIGALKFFGALAVLWFIDPVLTGLIAALAPFAVVYALHFNGKMNRALALSKERIAMVNARVEDALAGIRVVQSFGNQAWEIERFETENQRFFQSRKDSYRSEAWFSVGAETFAQLITITILVAGAVRILTADLTVAGLVTFFLCVAILVDPVQRLANFARLWQEGYTGFVRAMDLLDVAPDIVDRPGAITLERPKGEVRFERVGFAYPGSGLPVLKGLSFTIAPGEFVAIVGASGVGKSTVCALIPRFYEADSGRVLIDGNDVRAVTLASLRRHVGVVQQDVYLFSGTVAENLRYGRPGATEDEVVAAAKAAFAHDFITALPQGYATDIGQRGVRLSGGQKQRLTIARAFLKDPAILIFDEATSALDNESEKAVHQSLLTLAKGRTTIVIAHRLSTVRHADRIMVMTPDGIAEEGRHEALMAAGGLYADLHNVQGSI